MTKNKKKNHDLVLILGMHRSGTSLISGIIHELGYNQGKDQLIGTSDENKTGFYENTEVIDINEQILNSAMTSYITPYPIIYSSSKQIENRILNLLKNDLFKNKKSSIKDPRLSILGKTWLKVIKKFNVNLFPILVYRNYDEVISSIYKRDGFSQNLCALTWLNYNLSALFDYPKLTTISYNEILINPDSTISKLKSLNLNNESWNVACNKFIDKSLRRNKSEKINLKIEKDIQLLCEEFMSFLKQDENDKKKLVEFEKKLNKLREKYKNWFGNMNAFGKNWRITDGLRKQRDFSSQELDKNRKKLNDAQEKIGNFKQDIESKSEEIKINKNEIRNLNVRSKKFKQKNKILKAKLDHVNYEYEKIENYYLATKSSLSWKLTAPLRSGLNVLLIFRKLRLENYLRFTKAILKLDLNYIKNVIRDVIKGRGNDVLTHGNVSFNERIPKFSEVMKLFEVSEETRVEIDAPIDIIIPVYSTEKSTKFLKPLFESVKKNTKIPYRLIVINDRGPYTKGEQLLEELIQAFDNVEYIKNERNIGFLKSVNKGMKLTKNHFVILNTDVDVPKNWLTRLMAPILEDESIGTTTPFANAGEIVSFPRINFDNNLPFGLNLNEIDKEFRKYKLLRRKLISGVGFCMGINKKMINEIGCFNEIFGKGYGEENDLCKRGEKAGYKNILVTNLLVYHKHGVSFGKDKNQQLLDNLDILHDRYPDHHVSVMDYVKEDPLKEFRVALLAKIASETGKIEFVITHKLGGGTKTYLDNEYKKWLEEEKLIIEFSFDIKSNLFILEIISNDIKQKFKLNNFEEIETVVKFFEIKRITLNSLVSFPNVIEILEILADLKIKIEVKIHDYHAISPIYNLLNKNNEFEIFSNNKDYLNDKKDNANYNHSFGEYNDIELWRDGWRQLFDISDRIEIFSKSSGEILSSIFKITNKLKLKPHKLDHFKSLKVRNRKHNQVTIAMLGAINDAKGLGLFERIQEYVSEGNEKIELKIIGFASRKINSKIKQTGRYTQTDLPKILAREKIDLIYIGSIWPETFCYTAEEAKSMGIPLIVNNIGALPERVVDYDKGKIIDFKDNKFEQNFIKLVYELTGKNGSK